MNVQKIKPLQSLFDKVQKNPDSFKTLRNLYHLLPMSFRLFINPNDQRLTIEYTVTKLAKKLKDDFFFIKIGANDGIAEEPLAVYLQKYRWSGILVEPVNEIFEQLQKNYQEYENIICEKAAIADLDGVKDFYCIKDPNDELPYWTKHLGSFNLNIILKHKKFGVPNLEDYIVKESLPCMTLESLLAKHKIKQLALLSIDTEGYDYEIIKQINFKKIKPSIIYYEHSHLSADDRLECRSLLMSEGYRLLEIWRDTFAYQP